MGTLIFWVILMLIYFLPSLFALNRESIATPWIVVINLLFGWTIIFWIVCIIWAFSSKTKADKKREEMFYNK